MKPTPFTCPRCLRRFGVSQDMLPLHCCGLIYNHLDEIILLEPTPVVIARCDTCTLRRRFMEGYDPGCPRCSGSSKLITFQDFIGNGPGTELHHITKQLSLRPTSGCGCLAMLRKMNAWGVDGCQEHFDEIVAHVRKVYEKTDWLAIQRAKLAAVTSGLAWEIDRLDPPPSLVRLAIERVGGC